MERPCWTITIALIWVLTVPGIFWTHVAVSNLVPGLQDLPQKIVKGFDETFKFASLEQGSKDIKTASLAALSKCSATPNDACSYPTPVSLGPKKNVKAEKDTIVAVFDTSLTIVQKVVNDKYFGIDDLKETADNLNDIKTEVESAPDEMECPVVEKTFCEIHNNADKITDGLGQVNGALDKFRDNSIVSSWKEYSGRLAGLHALPWILVIGNCLFMIFWYRGGTCCPWGLCLIPFTLLWLVNFVLYIVILAAGVAIMYGADRVRMDMLKGQPTLDLVISHIKTEFADFWTVVFVPLVDGLMSLFNASCFFVPVILLIMIYALLMCCCRPYSRKAEVADEESGGSYKGPLNESAGRGFLDAARQEYVDGQGAKVGDFFSSAGGDAEAKFTPFEERIRGAGDKAAAISQIRSEWGL
eukprot:TRINITY_DN10037_c0_g2_i3.p1 TRINITY_DN10037_c0_g2~~TRINITY_DN10037_c0_g2_i3.p1  ORF type:complete len:414 (+),score=70.11 TRINITY_DN10037_c0_g2_i3:60-1301(+)